MDPNEMLKACMDTLLAIATTKVNGNDEAAEDLKAIKAEAIKTLTLCGYDYDMFAKDD